MNGANQFAVNDRLTGKKYFVEIFDGTEMK